MAAITDLAALTAIASGDLFVVNDVSAGTDKKITQADMLGSASTWTPVLAFGGASTGITYSAQTGIYNRVGTLVWIGCRLTLTSKGSATGSAVITGLPFAVTTAVGPMSVIIITAGTSIASIVAGATSSQINLYAIAAAGAAGHSVATDATFANTTDLIVGGCYRTS